MLDLPLGIVSFQIIIVIVFTICKYLCIKYKSSVGLVGSNPGAAIDFSIRKMYEKDREEIRRLVSSPRMDHVFPEEKAD